MASNREERKLMRQRGAASRKVKDVDFGFSFGSPKFEGSQESPQRQNVSASKPSTPSTSLKGTPTNKRLSTPSVPLSQRTPVRAGSQRSSSRTPGGSRNHLPERPSIYDIPVDDEPQERLPKRRKLGGVRESSANEQSNHDSTQNATSHAPEPSQDIQRHTTNDASDSTPLQPSTNGLGSSDQGPPRSPPPELGPQEGLPQAKRNRDEGDAGADKENVEDRDSHNPPEKKPPRKRKKRKSVVVKIGKSRNSAASELRRTSGGSQQTIDQSTPLEAPAGSDGPQHQTPGESSTQKPAGRKPKQQKSKKQAKAEKQSNARKVGRVSGRRRQPSQEHRDRESHERDEGHPNSGETSRGARQEPPADTAATEANARAEDDSQQQEGEKTDHGVLRTSGAQKRNASKRSRRQQTDVENAEAQGAPTPPESGSRRTSTTSKNKSTKKSKKSAPQRDSHKEGESRGENVPVVVHRLTNISALDVDLDDPNIDEEGVSREDGSAGRKYPSRSAANAADVLGQICSETLEKTTSTLDNSIAQESNPTRRAEWTRKRKAVEEFSTELDNRLFEMSEINESNFVLASQLKREKKEMEALRSQLMDVRKERGDIALQIDDVRRQYSEDQNAKREQDNLNNAFHDLQLALDRSHQGKDDSAETNLFAGLEFLLRTVAQDVSSAAPDAHGGLLNQVRSFNAQLERTASSLEQKR